MNSETSYKLPGRDKYELHKIWWLVLPILFFVVRYTVGRTSSGPNSLESWFKHELGIVENLTVVFLVAAAFITIGLLKRLNSFPGPLLKIFLIFYLIGLVYFAGEEASWGQHWFGWKTGGVFLEINDQQETNFHNTSEWLDRNPKGVVSFLIFVGGVLLPLLFYFKSWKINYQNRWWWLFPTLVSTPTAIFATIATWPSKIERATDWNFYFSQAQETKELYIAYFFLLFIISLKLRFARHFPRTDTAEVKNPDNNV